MNNGYRYSFSFEKLKRKMKPFSMRWAYEFISNRDNIILYVFFKKYK